MSRREVILRILEEQSFISVRSLQRETGASPATIRRDIDKLDKAGAAKKVHGGVASLLKPGAGRKSVSHPFVENIDICVEEKKAIAEVAGTLVRDGSIILIHGGSTCFYLGRMIAQRNVRVITHSMPLACYLSDHGTCQLTVGGGDLHREPGILFDPSANRRNDFAAQFFVGGLGVGEEGILESNPLLIRQSREMSAIATETIVLVDSRKFDERPPTVAMTFDKVDKLITDDGLSDKHAKMLKDQGVTFLVADTKRDPHA
ncbi:DeoR/GlpR family DNA-binding transcription regulator [Tropicimonas marinistellae]|uniref:DeoR/GlpR family DNA-binding transcription regulator n=1 Tax=Tropicimonas marinistellae TaxID=1739787 RepID=UPI001918CA1C|nr:DeoR/GlpR family DNA-binding transcription regulator [Tropicimonas marinistellae]